MRIRRHRALAMAACTGAIAAATALAPAAAQAAVTGTAPAKTPISNSYPHQNGRANHTKRVGNAAINAVINAGGQISGYTSWTITPPGGSAGPWDMGFNSNYTYTVYINPIYGTESQTVGVSGVSYSEWLGYSPYNADSMSLTDQVWISGTAVDVFPPTISGITVSVSGYTVTLTSSASNLWYLEHDFSNIVFNSIFPMSGPYENLSSTATFSFESFTTGIPATAGTSG